MHEEQARPSKRVRRSVAPGPFQLATDARGAAEEARLEGIRRQQEEQARRDAEFKVGMRGSRAADRQGIQTCAGVPTLCLRAGGRPPRSDARRDAFVSFAMGLQVQSRLMPASRSLQALPLNTAALAGTWKPPSVAPAPLTVPHEPGLHSDARAEQRRAFDDAVAAKQAEQQAERQRLLALQAAAEEEEVRQLRRGMVPKAVPLPGRL